MLEVLPIILCDREKIGEGSTSFNNNCANFSGEQQYCEAFRVKSRARSLPRPRISIVMLSLNYLFKF